MKTASAHVRNGQIILDDPVELPEGAALQVLLPEGDELTVEGPTDLEAEVEESAAEFERGEIEPARAFGLRLVARA